MRTVTLQNQSDRALVVVLDHPAFRDKRYGFTHTKRAVVEKQQDGSVGVSTRTVAVPGSVTLPPRGSVSGLHPAIANCKQVRNWLGATPPLVVIKDDPSRVPAPAADTQTSERRRPPRRVPEAPTGSGEPSQQ